MIAKFAPALCLIAVGTTLGMLTATASMAQTPPPLSGVTTMEAVEFPSLTGIDTDQQVIESLLAQGYEDITIVRSDDVLAVSGARGGRQTEMIFSAADGTLMMIDGIQPAPAN